MDTTDEGFSWNNLSGLITGLGSATGSVLNGLKPADDTAAKAASANAAGQQQTLKTVLPWAIGGLVLVVVAFVFLRK